MTFFEPVVNQKGEAPVGRGGVFLTRREPVDGTALMAGKAERQSPATRFNDTKRREPTHAESQQQRQHAVEQRCHPNPGDHVNLNTQPNFSTLC